ncbi:MAG: Acetophenone carboxylase gamma subunit [Alphaproteobacteria bacterium MarineAlpha11_Bin1]|mgnify:CR=1 FL=1|nr:MAG: Acetophenone carboxylase gamma subunit [Alphaproteobacteria bacterium MarineAlpha11_Bin1]|tara:strand:- start:1336 stop:3396 length:2061 start_codon:yes stop_codon:yes gene_type:complete
MGGYSFAVDIGGTFTDIVLRCEDGRTWVDKTLTTHENLLDGFFTAVDATISKARISPSDVDDVIVHATTVVTNAVLTRSGRPTALFVTEGFKDILHIRDEHRYDMFDPQIEYADPIVPRELTWGIKERTLANGTVSLDIDKNQITHIIAEIKKKKVEAVGICLLNAYVNGTNERSLRDSLLNECPELYVSVSSEVAPQIREYPRAATTALNAYTRPITEPYLTRLSHEIEKRGFASRPLIMMSNGGVLGTETASRFPVRMMESGPAAGALVASYYADRLGLNRLMSFDMGGTTAKACLIEDRKPLVTGLFEVDRMYRFKSGSGMPVIIPAIDMIEVGAGGGSIASIDSLGLLKVGPRSAGSEPGPACYGLGGKSPAVTDADVLIGILDPDNFLGGEMQLDKNAAETAIQPLADQLNTSVQKAARGIFQVVNESMAAAARAHATDRGIDYRGIPVLAFGGAGPVHACHVAELLESTRVIYPPLASVLSAFGTLVTPLRFDLARGTRGGIDLASAARIYSDMVTEAGAALESAGAPAGVIRYVYGADMRYVGQQNEVTVSFAADPSADYEIDDMREAFETAYEVQYGLRLPDIPIEVVAWRISAHGPPVERHGAPELTDVVGVPKGHREVLIGDKPELVAVYDRFSIAARQQIQGPVIIEERETTIFVLPKWHVSVAEDGCIIAEKGA